MKTKIIYISGSEVFDIADIRAAFEEVRTALSLDKGTVLFGVPVDCDDAFADGVSAPVAEIRPVSIPEPVIEPEPVVEPIHVEEEISVVVDSEPAPEEKVEKPKKTSRRSRAKVVPIVEEPVAEEPVEEATEEEKPAIPILSVLGAKSDSELVVAEPEPEPLPEPEIEEPEPIKVAPIDITPVEPEPAPEKTTANADTQHVSISDMLADDSAPVAEHEKTLEELLESMTPLGEDEKVAPEPIATPEAIVTPEPTSSDDTDATLELLATEFAEAADKIVAPTKTETRGKIGKLKNILPFKKAKRDDSGIMGDLFGWAGVANDEDFTIPGFFANATKK